MTMPPRLTIIGEHERPDHFHLPHDAKCYFWGEYTPWEHTNGLKWDFSPTNKLISNFKKKMDRVGAGDWQYKTQAINTIARAFSQFWKWQELHGTHRLALVPIPPSKARTDPMFDPRMMQVLSVITTAVGLPLDVRDCLSFNGAFVASHESGARPTPDDLYNTLSVSEPAARRAQPPGMLMLFDDVLTTGAHYLAASRRLAETFPGVPVYGMFVARRILPNPFADFEDLS